MARDMFGRRITRRFDAQLQWLDRIDDKLQPWLRKAVNASPLLRDALDGTWLGTPLHPALTDVPIGAASAALALDSAEVAFDDPAFGLAADGALAVGVLASLPAAVTGASDTRDLWGELRRIAVIHAILNAGALALNTYSVFLRANGRRGAGKAASAVGFLATTVAAHLGGELSFGHGVRVNQTVWHDGPTEFTEVLDEAELGDMNVRRVEVHGAPVLLARSRQGDVCAIAATCNHAGGPLDQGERRGDEIICPWHGSCFDLRTAEVRHGPAVFPQPRYETRIQNGKVLIRLAP